MGVNYLFFIKKLLMEVDICINPGFVDHQGSVSLNFSSSCQVGFKVARWLRTQAFCAGPPQSNTPPVLPVILQSLGAPQKCLLNVDTGSI